MSGIPQPLVRPNLPNPALDVLRIGSSPEAVIAKAMQATAHLVEMNQQWLRNLSVFSSSLEAPALEIHRLAVKGWVIDPMLIAVPEDTLFFLEAGPSRGTREEVAEALQVIIQRYEMELGSLVDDALKFLLGKDTEAYLSHSATFAVALHSVASSQAFELVTQSMLARTEGIFNQSLLIRGYSNRQVKGLLYSSDEARVEARREVLQNALKQAHERRLETAEGQEKSVSDWQSLDSAHERLIVACAAFSKGSAEDANELPFDIDGARNHAQHDGLGTETLDWAVRVLLWFAGMAVVLSEILPELPLEVTELSPKGTTP